MREFIGVGVKFLIVGGLSTLIEFGVFNLLVYTFGFGPVEAKIIASLVALVNAYFGNREWTFRQRGRHGRARELVLFVGVNVVCTLLGAGIVALGVALIARPGPLVLNAVNLVSVVIVVLARFVFYHWIVFPDRAAPTVPPVASGSAAP
jgi:putative flippase GtrA